MDRKDFEKDLIELLKKHGFHTEEVTRIRVDVEVDGMFLVNIEVQK